MTGQARAVVMHYAVPFAGMRAAWACRPDVPAPYVDNDGTPQALLTATMRWQDVTCREAACRDAARKAQTEQARQGLRHAPTTTTGGTDVR